MGEIKILVIDDDAQMCQLLKILLSDNGYQVSVALDGVEGVKIFHQFKPDLIITEIIMPNKDGLEVIMELLMYDQNISIIAMSGWQRTALNRSNLEIAKILGAKEVLLKPFVFKQLQKVIQSVLD